MKKLNITKVILTAIFWAVGISMVLPLIWMMSTACKVEADVFNFPIQWIPPRWNLVENMKEVWGGTYNFGLYYLNTIKVTLGATFLQVFVSALGAYGFSKVKFKGRDKIFLAYLATMMIPPQVTMVPLFSMMRHFPLAGGNSIFGQGGTGLVNTYTGLILPYIAGSFGVFLCRQFYVSFPRELDEAATIDGCSRFGTFVRIYLPLSGSILASLTILKVTGMWNEYTWPLIMTVASSDRVKTVQIALTSFRNEGEIFWNQLMAATLVVTAVVGIIFLCLQKYFVAGTMAGGVKE